MKSLLSSHQRRDFNQAASRALILRALQISGASATGLWLRSAQALSLDDLSVADASAGIKAALERGAGAAVGLLGKQDGFWGNPQVKIPLPGYLQDAGRMLRNFGMAQQVDDVEVKINRAAEQAVPVGKELLIGAIKSMTLSDAKNILTGGDGSATQFFAEKTRVPMGEKFLPIVTDAVSKVGLLEQYNRVAGALSRFGLVKPENATIQSYVTGKTLDGVFLMMGQEEKKIRQDPIGTGSALLKKVFGTL
jgi:hypothetical protein